MFLFNFVLNVRNNYAILYDHGVKAYNLELIIII